MASPREDACPTCGVVFKAAEKFGPNGIGSGKTCPFGHYNTMTDVRSMRAGSTSAPFTLSTPADSPLRAAGMGGTAKPPPMGSASQSACGCYSYESEGIKTDHWCEKHSPFGVAGTLTTATGEVLREGEDYERAAGVAEVPRG